jgi:hypothetical protein
LNALGRLLAVGSEWGSYVALVGGAAGRGLAREVAEEASETIGKQLARQAAQGVERASQRAIVIGENMNRVRGAAKALGASYYRAWRLEPFDAQLALRRNEAWIRRKVREGYLIYDIGIDLARDYRSPFYAMERRVLREMGIEPIPIHWPPSDNLRLFVGH